MPRENSPRATAWLAFLLLLGLSWGQNKPYQAFDWRPMLPPKQTSLHPYQEDTTQTSYDTRYFHTNPAPYHGSPGYYPDSPKSYDNSDSGHYPVDSYSSDYQKSQPYQNVPYQYPDNSGSYEQYTKDDNFNITVERYGGFGGSGDTRGFGAYDYPKKVQDVPQELHEGSYGVNHHKIDTEFPDLLRVGAGRSIYHRRNPMHVHPLPPPL